MVQHHRYEIVGGGNKTQLPPSSPHGRWCGCGSSRPWWLVATVAVIVTALCWKITLETQVDMSTWPVLANDDDSPEDKPTTTSSLLRTSSPPAENPLDESEIRSPPTTPPPTATSNGGKKAPPIPTPLTRPARPEPKQHDDDDSRETPFATGEDDDDDAIGEDEADDGIDDGAAGDDDDEGEEEPMGLFDAMAPFSSDDDEDETEEDDTTTTLQDSSGDQERRPDVAWIVSFGGSGTSYTILNVESLSGRSTASNYAQDYEELIPVQPSFEHGPYIRSPNKPLPEQYILTKTHCGGYCMDCPPSLYVFETAYDFQEACRTAHTEVDGALVEEVYAADIPKRAVHLVRSPFDNLVGRFHLSVRRQSKIRADVTATELEEAFPDTTTGLANWCRYLDDKYAEQESHYPVLAKYKDVPCHAEWFRYIQWHNLADTVLRDLDIPVHYLWYHNYTSGFNETVQELFDFLSLEASEQAYPWYNGHSYQSFFPPSLTTAAISMMKDLASANTWRLIKDYIADYTDVQMLYDTPEEVAQEEEVAVELEDDDDDGTVGVDETKVNTKALPAKSNNIDDPDPQVVWLLSFPNSGTSYTIMNVEKMADVTTGTTYARDLKEATAITSHGPFLHRQDKRTPHYVLTKTHCAGFCNQCKPSAYMPSADPYHFTQACTRVERPANKSDGEEYDYFPEYLPVKAVHLFRDPFDNIVSRMHLEVKKEHADFSTSKDGLANYCSYLDGMFTQEEREAFDEETHKLFRNVPCHADFYRYVIWHNQALEMTDRLALPVHYLHYEEYTNDFAGTNRRLLDFLQLKATNDPLAFATGKVYRHLWNDSLDSVRALAQHVATPATWAKIRHYFSDDE